jgi:hypothetical protein
LGEAGMAREKWGWRDGPERAAPPMVLRVGMCSPLCGFEPAVSQDYKTGNQQGYPHEDDPTKGWGSRDSERGTAGGGTACGPVIAVH